MRVFRFIPNELIGPYKKYCLTIGSWTENRISCLSSFDTYCHNHESGELKLTQEMIDGWCSKRSNEKVNTLVARSKPIKHFLCYLRERGRCDLKDPIIPPSRPSTHVPHPFTKDELKKFFYECDHVEFHQCNKRNNRNLQITIPVFFRFLYSSGIRPSGARLLKLQDINLNTSVINIRKTKGANQHYIVLHDTMMEIMRQYNVAISELYPNREYFFPDKNDSFHPNYWVAVHFRNLWRKISNTPAVPYAFRHNYAVVNINNWVNHGFDFYDRLVYLSKSMGHCDLESTKYYYSLVPAMSSILQELTEDTFNSIIPEVNYEES